MFNEQKAAQIAAWFLGKAGGTMPHLKLMKLMYLAERESMAKHGFPMTGESKCTHQGNHSVSLVGS